MDSLNAFSLVILHLTHIPNTLLIGWKAYQILEWFPLNHYYRGKLVFFYAVLSFRGYAQ